MDMYLLEYFKKVAETESITKAAVELHLNQPTLSKCIKNIENQLGVELFDRSSKKIKLTKAGYKFYNHVDKILSEWNETTRDLGTHKLVEKGSIHIAAFHTCNWYLLPCLLPGFVKEYPYLKIFIDRDYSDSIIKMVLNRHQQAGIVVSPVSHPKLKEIPLYMEEYAFMVPKGHPWYELKKINLMHVKGQSIIAPSLDEKVKYYMVQLQSWLGDTDIDILLTIHDHDTMFRLLKGGIKQPALVTYLGRKFWNEEEGQIRIIGLDPPIKRQISWIERIDKYRTPACEAFFQAMVEYIKLADDIESLV